MTQTDTDKQPETVIIQVEADLMPGENRRMIGQAGEHTIILDVKKERGGEDAAPAPPEYLALSLGGCVLNMVRVMASTLGLPTDGLRVTVSGDLDPAKAFGLSSKNRAGFLGIHVLIKPPEDWSDEMQDNMLEQLQERCPICDTIQNPCDLTIRFD